MSAVPEPRPARPYSWLRLTGLILGITFVFWLPVEDQSEVAVIVFSAAICTWIAARLLASSLKNDFQLVFRHALLGIAGGFALVPVALLLMAIKTGIHGHDTPDFLIGQMLLVISRWFYFIASGLLVSLGTAMWRLAKRRTAQVQV